MSAEAERRIFDAGMGLIAALPSLPPTAWPNVEPEEPWPPVDGPWLEVAWFPGEGRDDWWDAGPKMRRGFFMLRVFGALYQGAVLIDEAQRLIDLLPKGSVLVEDVRLSRSPWMAPLIVDKKRAMIPVTVPYSGLL